MNKVLLALNVVLLAAVGFLYFQHYEYKKKDHHVIQETKNAAATPFKIAYFELDSLESKYEYLKEVQGYLRDIDAKNTKYLRDQQEAYMQKVKEYQQKGPTMSQAEQGQYEQDLMARQNKLRTEQEDRSQQIGAEQMRKMQEVKQKIRDGLRDYCKERGYSYVFASSDQDNLIYYKDSLRDVTGDIIKLLNDKYAADKKKK
ncbi:OmpH family outer membrane protein [Foetidibacter luteolus]|uniref:OmpH family outer membrane protein n=1 Tax=Foetidibacter luteolus TaxID=2608880 RepID=UPI00129C10A5|nr:OmpH family outer membrane protein [Foetidibacter luteolus]